MPSFAISGRNVAVYPAKRAESPVVYLNTVENEGTLVREALRGAPDHTLVTIGGLDWECDMAPWDIPPIAQNATPCIGGADAHLRLLTQEIVPAAEKNLLGQPLWRGIAGYSLAGLFAIYALYRTDSFSRAASMSGSLWFPGFRDYALSRPLCRRPERLYFSLGNKEDKTRNPYLKPCGRTPRRWKPSIALKGLTQPFGFILEITMQTPLNAPRRASPGFWKAKRSRAYGVENGAIFPAFAVQTGEEIGDMRRRVRNGERHAPT